MSKPAVKIYGDPSKDSFARTVAEMISEFQEREVLFCERKPLDELLRPSKQLLL